MENFQDRGVWIRIRSLKNAWIRIRIRFVLRGWIRIQSISDRIRNSVRNEKKSNNLLICHVCDFEDRLRDADQLFNLNNNNIRVATNYGRIRTWECTTSRPFYRKL